jgi:hypothetical protein
VSNPYEDFLKNLEDIEQRRQQQQADWQRATAEAAQRNAQRRAEQQAYQARLFEALRNARAQQNQWEGLGGQRFTQGIKPVIKTIEAIKNDDGSYTIPLD